MWDEEDKEMGFMLLTVIIIMSVYLSVDWLNDRLDDRFSREERESMTEIYDTEDIFLLKKLEDYEDYSKYEVLIDDEIKQAIYIKDNSELVIVE